MNLAFFFSTSLPAPEAANFAFAAFCWFCFFRSRSFCFPLLVALASSSSFFIGSAPLFSSLSSSPSHHVMNFFTLSRFTSLFNTVSTAFESLPMISCLTRSIVIFFGTAPGICRFASKVIKVVFPHPFLPIRPYRRPFAIIRLAFCKRSGPPPRKLGKSNDLRCTSALLSFAESSKASGFISSSSCNISTASFKARCRSSSSMVSRIFFCRSLRRALSDFAASLLDMSIILA
mmetsp:Transcript_14720/g.21716  ORF Transcript_14720/g.21716 Transcript_14720/m.21716 type:complete len:232 (+) Transcript_14720:1470-2165(+)